MLMCVWKPWMCTWQVVASLELELQAVVNGLMSVLGTELGWRGSKHSEPPNPPSGLLNIICKPCS